MAKKDDFYYEKSVFAERLYKIMDERGENCTSLARKLSERNIPTFRQTISQYLNGSSGPDNVKLSAIAELLNVSCDWLLGLSDTKSVNMDIKATCDLTGLDENSVSTLSLLHSAGTNSLAAALDFLVLDYKQHGNPNSILGLLSFFLKSDLSGIRKAVFKDGNIVDCEGDVASGLVVDGALLDAAILSRLSRRLEEMKQTVAQGQ